MKRCMDKNHAHTEEMHVPHFIANICRNIFRKDLNKP